MTDQEHIDTIASLIALVKWARRLGDPHAIAKAEAELRAAVYAASRAA